MEWKTETRDEYNQKLILGEVITLIKLSLRLILKEKKVEFIRNVRYRIIINYSAIEKIKMSCFEKIC